MKIKLYISTSLLTFIALLMGHVSLNIQDIVLIVNYILFDQDYTENADLNQDYGINILDITLLFMRYLMR